MTHARNRASRTGSEGRHLHGRFRQALRVVFTTDRLCSVPLPPFDPTSGLLPSGEHPASWGEVLERFGWNLVRRRLLDGLAEGLSILADAGCTRVWLNGSFVTAKEEPGDFDAVWSPVGVDADRLRFLSPEMLDLNPHRVAQKRRFGGEFFPNIVEGGSGREFAVFFQFDRDGTSKGIVVIDPSKEIWE
jgi:hypothetical protein